MHEHRRPQRPTPRGASLSRRRLVQSGTLAGLGLSLGPSGRARAQAPRQLSAERAARIEQRLAGLLAEHEVPGCAAGLIEDGQLVWSAGFGFADLERRLPMTADTLLNIGSVTKTVTATAVLQLVQEGLLNLDDDAGAQLDFPLRNPRHPDLPITVRQLLTHRSSILDGPEYEASYVCGDPPRTLGDWLAEYFGGEAPERRYHDWAPGEPDPPASPRAYSNVAFGVLGHLVEVAGGQSFEDACREYVFDPLGMAGSGFSLERIDTERHAVPYSRVPTPVESGGGPGGELASDFEPQLPRYPLAERPPVPGGHFAHCLYSFATPPDGLLRTSVRELARFLGAWARRGRIDDTTQLLDADIVNLALAETHFGRALCWSRLGLGPGEPLVYHDGGDPGIATWVGFRPEERSGALLFFNTSEPGDMLGTALRALLVE